MGLSTLSARTVPAVATLAGAVLLGGCSSTAEPTAAARAFADAVGQPGRSVHVDVTGRITSPFGADFTATYDLVGSDFVGSTVLTSEGMGAEQGLAGIGGQTFSRYGDNAWALEDRAFARPDPFAGVAFEDLEVAGTDRRDERDVVHLRVREAEAALGVIALYGSHFLTATRVDRLTFDLLVSTDGAPISADVRIEGAVAGELSGPVSAAFALRFSAWGATTLVPPFKLATFPPGTTFVADNAYDEPIILRDVVGLELLVPACGRSTSDSFDGSTYDVRFAVDGNPILSVESVPGRPQRYVLVAPSSAHGEALPYVEPTKAPCTGRGA